MTHDSEFDASRVGGALLVLKSELSEELLGATPERALRQVRYELLDVIRRARVWAAERGVPRRFLPEPPPPDVSPEGCIALLDELSEVLRFLGVRDKVPGSLVELVEWLAERRAPALSEFVDLREEVGELASALQGLEKLTRALSASLAETAVVLNGNTPALNLARAQANEVFDLAQVLREALDALELRLAGALGGHL